MVNELGFIETGYCPIVNKKFKIKLNFLMHLTKPIAILLRLMLLIRKPVNFSDDKVLVRHQGNYLYVDAESVNYVDLSPKQLVSVSSALIPILGT